MKYNFHIGSKYITDLRLRRLHYPIVILLISFLFSNCTEEQTLFNLLTSEETGIDFNNIIVEDDTHNILNFVNLYTGSGVGIGDFDKNGLPDIFFGGNIVSSNMYLNNGNFEFEDVTTLAGVETDRWITGVAVVDINSDGWDDIYITVSGNAEPENRKNLLFINQKDMTFKEEASAYGVDDSAHCKHSSFFDYDQDGDLDLIVIINPTNYKLYNVNTVKQRKLNGESESTDKLYRNNGDNTFTDVSREAGILIEGYSLSLNVSDLNADGWSDIYITNDFLTNDILYINNQDGTFTNRASEMLDHTSFASMGVDVADINNDGQPEIYVLDMYPEDDFRQKMIMSGGNYDRFEYILKAGYEPQYSRNTLQLNNGYGNYSEIGQMSGVHKTDWSWSALLADFDNDGLKDIFVTNGFRRDMGDLDFINYKNNNPFGDPMARKEDQKKRIKELPGAKLPNYAYKNMDGINFEKVSKEWGVNIPSYSHGAAFADLDNDGDLDLVTNNVSMPAFIYENRSSQINDNHYINIKLDSGEEHDHGAKVWIYYGENQMQYLEYQPYRGYQSTVAKELHFGLGEITNVRRVLIEWPSGAQKTIHDLMSDSTYIFNNSDSNKSAELREPYARWPTVATSVAIPGLNFEHKEDFRVDFKSQPLLPHQHSRSGPCMCAADINNDGVDDIYVGSSSGQKGKLFISDNGGYTESTLSSDKRYEEVDCKFLDVDNDGDQDLYVVSGGPVDSAQNDSYQDQLYLNLTGQFEISTDYLPIMNDVGSCVLPHDYNDDGLIDLFVGGRVSADKYPNIPRSYFLENLGGNFADITTIGHSKVGMVTDGVWTDYDNDGDKDLILVGEFMPITVVEVRNKVLQKPRTLINQSNGWWNTISAGDFDNDGDIDFLAGNLGLNSDLKASKKEPLTLYANDFDKNGSLDPILCKYVDGVERSVAMRDQIVGQIPPMKVRFNDYKSFAEADFEKMFKGPEKKGMYVLHAYELASQYIENKGNGNFEMRPLPIKMQLAPINKFGIKDINNDGNLDALAIGNSFATNVSIGRYDAFSGAALLGQGNGEFDVYLGSECGFETNKDSRSMVNVTDSKENDIIVVGNNSDVLQTFKMASNILVTDN